MTRSSWSRTSTAGSSNRRNGSGSSSRGVDEVGGPTILATFTVIAALLPMAFVTGLMGPYMSPIPINASMGMFISLAVAFVVTPWLAQKMPAGRRRTPRPGEDKPPGVWTAFPARVEPFLDPEHGGRANPPGRAVARWRC